MRDNIREDTRYRQRKRSGGDAPDPSIDRPMEPYTAEQRAQLQRGLRILARMIVRVHLRGEIPKAASPSTKPPSEKGSGG